MRVYELIAKLMKVPAGAKVFIDTRKPIEELLIDNLSDDEEIADISFPAKFVREEKDEDNVTIIF